EPAPATRSSPAAPDDSDRARRAFESSDRPSPRLSLDERLSGPIARHRANERTRDSIGAKRPAQGPPGPRPRIHIVGPSRPGRTPESDGRPPPPSVGSGIRWPSRHPPGERIPRARSTCPDRKRRRDRGGRSETTGATGVPASPPGEPSDPANRPGRADARHRDASRPCRPRRSCHFREEISRCDRREVSLVEETLEITAFDPLRQTALEGDLQNRRGALLSHPRPPDLILEAIEVSPRIRQNFRLHRGSMAEDGPRPPAVERSRKSLRDEPGRAVVQIGDVADGR